MELALINTSSAQAWGFSFQGKEFRLVNYNGSGQVVLYYVYRGQLVTRGIRPIGDRAARSVAHEWAEEITKQSTDRREGVA